jgi:capsular exopolysaccharide synthesis family protein
VTAAAREESPAVQIELLPHMRPRLAVSEAYRSLRTALLLASARELRAIAITSAVPGEGKTSTAANLAVVLAQLPKRVLLVDGDLRKPRIHEVFGGSNRAGLVNFLTQGAAMDQLVFQSKVPNLWLAPSGPLPPNPSELLASARMREFVEWARSSFDIVIFDSAPTLAVTDAILLGKLTDGVVLCLRAGYVQRRDAKACRDRLQQAEVRLLGAVLNCHRGLDGSYRSRSSRGYTEEAYGADAGPSSSIDRVAAL